MKEVLSCEVMSVANRNKQTIYVSGECSCGYNEQVKAWEHGRYGIYLDGNRLRYFQSLKGQKRYNYLTKLINQQG